MRRFWLWWIRYGMTRLVEEAHGEPDGIPFRRSAEYPCNGFEPRKRRVYDWGDCETDGHYLCGACCHNVKMIGKREHGDKEPMG